MFSPTQPDSQPEKPKNDNNIDDLFSSPASSAPKAKNDAPVDDLFSAPPPQNSPYTPPPPQPQQRGGNRVLYIILGVVIAFMCVCIACIAVAGGSVFAVFQDPTVQAGLATGKASIATVQGIVGTGVALASVPTALPPDAVSKGSISTGVSQTSTLGAVSRDMWKYDGKGGDKITILVKPQNSELSMNVAIYGTNDKLISKNLVLSDTDPGFSVKLPDDGTYSIVVASLGGIGDSTGAYTITVQGAR